MTDRRWDFISCPYLWNQQCYASWCKGLDPFVLFQFYVKSADGSKRKHMVLGLTLTLTAYLLFESFRWFGQQGSYSMELVILVKIHLKVKGLHCPKTLYNMLICQVWDFNFVDFNLRIEPCWPYVINSVTFGAAQTIWRTSDHKRIKVNTRRKCPCRGCNVSCNESYATSSCVYKVTNILKIKEVEDIYGRSYWSTCRKGFWDCCIDFQMHKKSLAHFTYIFVD